MPTQDHLYVCESTGLTYGTGLEPPKHPGLCSASEEQMPIYSRQEILARVKANGGKVRLDYTGPILNQGQYKYCWDFSTVQMVMLAIELAYGDQVVLDASIAPSICDSIGSGDSIDDCWKKVVSVYGLPTAEFMGTDPTRAKIKQLPSQWPAGWEKNASERKGVSLYTAGDFLSLVSGVLNGHPGLLGVNCDGGGHAIGCAEVGVLSDGESLYMATPGTWGKDYASGWGAYPESPGWYKLSERQCSAAWSGPSFGAYVIIAVQDQDATPDLN